MSGSDLFEGMSYVDERFVDEAETVMIPKRNTSPWVRAAAMAACLCLVLFSVYNLNPIGNCGETEGAAGESVEDQARPMEGLESNEESKIEEDSMEAVMGSPEDKPTGEAPSVILRVDEMTDVGFIGTVAKLVDTDIFEVGMELNVVIAESTREETVDANPSMFDESETDYSGSYVMVQFIEYDKDSGIIVVNIIQEADAPEETP